MTAIALRTLADIEPSNQVYHLQITGDPTAGDGLVAGIGSLATRMDGSNPGSVYRKTGSGATAWALLDLATHSETTGASTTTGLQTRSFTGSLVAHAGGTQAAALALPSMVNRVITVGTAGDSVLLPATVASVSIGPITVINAAAANSLNVFATTGGAINAGAADAAYALAAGSTATFYSAGANQWHAIVSA